MYSQVCRDNGKLLDVCAMSAKKEKTVEYTWGPYWAHNLHRSRTVDTDQGHLLPRFSFHNDLKETAEVCQLVCLISCRLFWNLSPPVSEAHTSLENFALPYLYAAWRCVEHVCECGTLFHRQEAV